MNEFKDLVMDALDSGDHFQAPEPNFHYRYQAMGISAHTSQSGSNCTTHSLQLDELLDFFVNPLPGRQQYTAGPEAAFKLISIPTAPDGALVIRSNIFRSLLEPAGIDPGALWLVMHKYDGFHHFPSRKERGRETFFFGYPIFAVVWTFDYETLNTHAILIERGLTTNILRDIMRTLEHHGPYIFSPGFVGYAASLLICARYDSVEGEGDWRCVRHIEKSTGYRLDGRPRRTDLDIDQLTQWLQQTGQVLINTSVRKRTLRIIVSILNRIALDGDVIDMGRLDPEIVDKVKESTRKLIEAMPQMRSRIHAYSEFMDYMTIRVERLSAVLFALLTHKDAEIGIEQAQASRELAEAAKRDSSAMKTIAVMTMAFLPATFFAALFAMPTLDWNGDTVIKNNHWVYWAFTLPVTLLVFLIWVALNNTNVAMEKFSIQLKRKEKGKGTEKFGATAG